MYGLNRPSAFQMTYDGTVAVIHVRHDEALPLTRQLASDVEKVLMRPSPGGSGFLLLWCVEVYLCAYETGPYKGDAGVFAEAVELGHKVLECTRRSALPLEVSE